MVVLFDRPDGLHPVFPFLGIVLEQKEEGWNSWREDGRWREFGAESELDITSYDRVK